MVAYKRVGFGVSQAARSPRFQLNDKVLRREMRWGVHVGFPLPTGMEGEEM